MTAERHKLITDEAMAATEAAALAAARQMGRGDRHGADRAAVEAMRNAMEAADLSGTIVIGEGERDEAPMLFIGEQVGNPEAAVMIDIAVDPLEGTNLVATGARTPSACYRLRARGLIRPDTYLRKLIVDPVAGRVSINDPVEKTIRTVPSAWPAVSDITVVLTASPR
jgi:fructose-1,6-bisphosphatase II